MSEIILKINSILVDYILVIALASVGIFYTIYTRGVQFRKFGYAFKQTFSGIFKKREDGSGVSSFQALAVAIAAQVGTGNVAGVATAIMAGGPGAIFWMWLMALIGMATIFAEAVLAQKFREKDEDGNWVGGPAYYIQNGFKNKSFAKFLSKTFAVLIILALGFFGNMTQSNSIAVAVNAAFPQLPLIVIGVIISIIAALVFIGGIKRIANFAQLVVPIMALLYVILAIITLIKFNNQIIPSLELVFKAAFTPEAAAGGALGYGMKKAITYGVARGLFSNEAGMGSTPHAHAVAEVKNPVEQGFTAMIGVFIDTIVICTATALIIFVTGANNLGLEGALVTQKAFEIGFGPFGKILLAVALSFFAFTTIIGRYYFGETNVKFLFGDKGLTPYRIIVIIFLIVGSTQKINLVWNLSDLFNSLMVIPNVIALFILHKVVKDLELKYDPKKVR